MNKLIRCSRCARRLRNPRADTRWNLVAENGVVTGYLCPNCQTAEENAEAEINLATLDYTGAGPDGLLRATVKGGAA